MNQVEMDRIYRNIPLEEIPYSEIKENLCELIKRQLGFK